MKPFLSIVVPTRDRPSFVGQALESLRRQTQGDFEVIVSDNALRAPCRAVCDAVADERVRYVTPPRALAMQDHWEFACGLAKGEYVAVMIDKTVWLPSAVRSLHEAVRADPVDVVTWWEQYYRPADEERDLGNGTYHPAGPAPRPPARYDGRAELARRLSFAVPRGSGSEGPRYYRGKLCFGAYRRDLLRRIEAFAGRVFPAISPDYTSMAAALGVGETFLDLGRPLQLVFLVSTSNGNRLQRLPAHSRAFLHEVDPSGRVLDELPISGLYASQHNVVARDYVAPAARLGLVLDMANLCRRAREDLLGVAVWPSSADRREQFDRLRAAERRWSRAAPLAVALMRAQHEVRRPIAAARPGLARGLARLPAFERRVRRVTGRDGRTTARHLPDIQAAAALADSRFGVPEAMTA